MEQINNLLNTYLSTYQIHYQNLRGFHWNISGKNFFPLHEKFAELYNNAQETIDDIAERILTLDGKPACTYSNYIELSVKNEINSIDFNETEMIEALTDDFISLIKLEKEILALTAQLGEDGTNDMVNGFMQFKQKNLWMMKAYLK